MKREKEIRQSITQECLKKLKSLKDRNIIDQGLYYKLKPTASPAPRFYGLPKIHKAIVSYTGTPLYKISKHIANILTTYVSRKGWHSENSKIFSEQDRKPKVKGG